MKAGQERHRPGLLKQQNKAHKHGSHRSKHALNSQENKKPTGVKVLTKKLKKCVSKQERINRMTQLRAKKRDEILEKKRQLGGTKSPPFLVAVVSLAFDVDTAKCLEIIKTCSENSDVVTSSEGVLHLSIDRLKQKFSILVPEKGNVFSILDGLKAADTVLFLISALSNPFVDEVAQGILPNILAQGLPSVAVAVADLEKVPLKKRSNCKQEIQKSISHYLPDEKIMSLDTTVDAFNLLRKIGSQKQRAVFQRDHRPHLLAEHLEFSRYENSNVGTLKVSGFLRGRMLSVHSLIHIPGWGDFQMSQIDVVEDPRPNAKKNGEEERTVRVLQVADPSKRRDLTSENVPDPMDAEQTWPTAEDFSVADQERKEKKKIKRVPKGMSDYQACWIPDEEDEDLDDEEESDGEDLEKMEEEESDDDGETGKKVRFEEPADDTATEVESNADEYDENMDMDEENEARGKFEEAKMDRMFPDEVDTPLDVPARERFQKYRGLASFRTSPWDPKENLPYDYARIFQFENFKRTRKRVFSELENEQVEGATPGMFLTVHVIGVPSEKFSSRRPGESALILYGMLEHEQKMSVVNMVLKRQTNSPLSQIPVKSKEELVFQCGYRRFKARPIFSQHTNGSKHKYERYFQPDSIVVATVFAPVTFPPASVLVFKENPRKEGSVDFLASGSVLSVNPDRLIIKRVVLSGHPLKIHKKSAVIRFMFFNREDIDWFKPVELKTKFGRRGHIKEPLGTHGHMKAVFDGQLKSQDTVLMYLYKRIFPKWSYDPMVKHTFSEYDRLPVIREEDMEDE